MAAGVHPWWQSPILKNVEQKLLGTCAWMRRSEMGHWSHARLRHATVTCTVRKYKKKQFTLLDLCVSSLRRGHANLLCIVPILSDDPKVSKGTSGPNGLVVGFFPRTQREPTPGSRQRGSNINDQSRAELPACGDATVDRARTHMSDAKNFALGNGWCSARMLWRCVDFVWRHISCVFPKSFDARFIRVASPLPELERCPALRFTNLVTRGSFDLHIILFLIATNALTTFHGSCDSRMSRLASTPTIWTTRALRFTNVVTRGWFDLH